MRLYDINKDIENTIEDMFANADKETGEVLTIISRMWNENVNLMECLSDKYTYLDAIQDAGRSVYTKNAKTRIEIGVKRLPIHQRQNSEAKNCTSITRRKAVACIPENQLI